MNQDRTSTTITNPQLKEGYKQTEVGVIPEDWNATNLGKFMMLQRGYDLPHRERKIGDIPIITSSGFGGTHSEFRALAPGVVTGRYGTIGDVFYVQEDFWPLNTTLYIKNFYGNNPLFASYLLKTIDFHSHSGKSGVPGVNRNDLHELVVCIPPLPEQEAIACTLSDIDELIESLDRLITKKRQIKQGAMQELLAGKKRLPKFDNCQHYIQTEIGVIPENWQLVSLTTIADVRDGTHDSPKYVKEGVPFITSKNITNGKIDFQDIECISTEDAYQVNKRSKVDKDDILMSMIGTVGNVALVDFDLEFCIKNVALIKPIHSKIEATFLTQLFRSDFYGRYVTGKLDGGIQKFISLGILRCLEVPLPPTKDEQIEIATILSDIDAEIGSISAKLAKTRQLKQGMMHELLTGRIRLV